MKLPGALHKNIVEFLTAIPSLSDSKDQQALIFAAVLDSRLQSQITFGGSSAQFIRLLVPKLTEYGKLADGRNALEAVLAAAKEHTGQEGKAEFDALVKEIRAIPVHTPSPPEQSTPRFGRLVGRMCNRNRQVNEFWRCFRKKIKECPGRPQFYLLHGNELEGHESFITRLMNTCLKSYVEKAWGAQCAEVRLRTVSWPDKGDLKTRKTDLQMNLMAKFDQWYANADYSASALSQLPCLNLRSLVIIHHNIFASEWDYRTEKKLIEWYVREYWAALETHGNIPQFLIFLTIKYPTSKKPDWRQRVFRRKQYPKEQIAQELREILESAEALCPCLMIKELTPVTRKDVSEWFSEHKIYENAARRHEKINEIFRENGKIVEVKSMAKVEMKLEEILKAYEAEILVW